jgi:hypothetical protein
MNEMTGNIGHGYGVDMYKKKKGSASLSRKYSTASRLAQPRSLKGNGKQIVQYTLSAH